MKWVEETVSGRVSWRKRPITGVLGELQTGDNLLVSELSRLGPSKLECMEILSVAYQQRAGVKLGKPKGVGKSKLDKHRPDIEALLANGSAQKYIAGRFGTTEANLSRWLKKHGLRRKSGVR